MLKMSWWFSFCFVANLVVATVESCGAKSSSGDKQTATNCKSDVANQCSDQINEAIASLKAQESTLEEKLEQLIALISNKRREETSFASCREIYQNHRSEGNKAYMLQMDIGKTPIYCHMSSTGLGACGGGGWTLALKIDGTERNFHYDSVLWTNKIDFNLNGGKTGLDRQETKLPSYWNTPFHKICLGMRIGHQVNFIVIYKRANSLYSLIADGVYRRTSLGRDTWKRLIGVQASLQKNCDKEGFNAVSDNVDNSRARIGILGNNENECASCDSRIGIGTGGLHDDSNTCGNEATYSPDNGDKHMKTMGYVLVQ